MNRNELLNLLYLDRGASIVGVVYTTAVVVDPLSMKRNGRRMEEIEDDATDFLGYAERTKGQTIYHYRAAPDLNPSRGDLVVVPARDGYALATVVEIHNTIPTALKPGVSMRWVAQKVDLRRLRELEADETRVVDTIRGAEVKTKLAEIEKSMGFALDSIATPALLPGGVDLVSE
jgi:hypothetical protein